MKKILVLLSIILFLTSCILLGSILFTDSTITDPLEPVYESDIKSSAYKKIHRAINDYNKFAILFPEFLFLSNDEISDLSEDVYLNSPALMGYKGASYSLGILFFDYSVDRKTLQERKDEMMRKVQSIVSSIKNKANSVYDRTRLAHDYLIDNVTYDNFLVERAEKSEEFYESAHDAYGALMNGIAVCDGYAKALKLLLDQMEIQSLLVYGTARDINHSWNMVKLENAYYHVDVTWDDPDLKHIFDEKLYIYFGLNDEMISKNHVWDRNNYPICNATKYNFYHYVERISTSFDQLTGQLSSSLNSGKRMVSVLLKIASPNESSIRSAISTAIKKSGIAISEYTYVFDEDISCLTVGFIEK